MVDFTVVTKSKAECPTCLTESGTICDDCGKSWKYCLCVDSHMACEICHTYFKWMPAVDDASSVSLDSLDEEGFYEQMMIDPYDDGLDDWEDMKLGNTRGGKKKKRRQHYSVQQPASTRFERTDPKQYAWGDNKQQFKSGCDHDMTPVVFTWKLYEESVTVHATAGRQQSTRKTTPDFGLYADAIWKPINRNEFINWPDFGVPTYPKVAAMQIVDAFIRACQGERVEIGCIGAHGRTGTILACMGVLAGYTTEEAIKHVRNSYCSHAIETEGQEEWIQWFNDYLFKGTVR